MSRINLIKKCLALKGCDKYLIREVETKSYQNFFVLQKLETMREVNTLEDEVVIYKDINEGTNSFIGSASFMVLRTMSKAEILAKIDETLYQASFVHNEKYELVKGDKKKSVKIKGLNENPLDVLANIAKIYIEESKSDARFNSLELFFDIDKVHLVNSCGVDYQKETFDINVEAVPSFYSDEFKTELYRFFEYSEINYDTIREDAKSAILDLYNRGNAKPLENVKNCNVILHGRDSSEMIWEYISTFSYHSIYTKSNLANVGDTIQENPVCPLNVSFNRMSASDFFDEDGVLLNKTEIIKDGKLVSSFGTNRFAYYLGVKPTGHLSKIDIKAGKKSFESFKKKPYIEIFDLSGIQVDAFQNYIGGEVRLAIYFDGKNTYPVSGFSFSTELDKAINSLEFSKEFETKRTFACPKYTLIKNCELI